MDRFLLAENPRTDSGGLAIIHTIDPQAIIECLEGHVVVANRPHRHYSFVNSDGVPEHWTLSAHHLFTTNMAALDDANAQAMVDKLLGRAWNWFKAYLQWEDQNINESESANEN